MSAISNILEFFSEGLHRVARVIDGSADYDDLMLHKLSADELRKYSSDVAISDKRREAIEDLSRKLRSTKHKVLFPSFTGFACEGSTANNIREFEFFDRICGERGISVSQQNYTDLPRTAAPALSATQTEALEIVIADLTSFYQARETVSASLVHQHLLYSQAFFSFLLSFTARGANLPDALVTANDHSPVRVALSMVMKGLRVPRVYLQHAEVTSNFPPLDFEYSVLRNRRSLETYQEIGPVAGRTYVISRQAGPFAGRLLEQERSLPVNVAVYPTSRVLAEPLKELLAQLRSNPGIGKIIIKEHPGAAVSLAEILDPGVAEVTKAALGEDHVAIVGNSSVAIELLHRGIPVYQNFSFDPVDRDYYGFVEHGITKEISIDDASGPFWTPYALTAAWLKRFGEWDPSATDEGMMAQADFLTDMMTLKNKRAVGPNLRGGTARPPKHRKSTKVRKQAKAYARRNIIKLSNSYPRPLSILATGFVRLGEGLGNMLLRHADRVEGFLAANTAIRIRPEAAKKRSRPTSQISGNDELGHFVFDMIMSANDPVHWLNENEKFNIFPAAHVIDVFQRAFKRRDPQLQSILARTSNEGARSAAAWWLQLKKSEIANLALTVDFLDTAADYVYRYRDHAKARARLERELLSALLRAGTASQLDRFWTEAEGVTLAGLSVPNKYQVLRRLRKEPGRDDEAEQLLVQIHAEATDYEVLRLENSAFLDGVASKDWSHLKAERDFEALAPGELKREFTEKVKPAFDRLRPRMRFMDLRSDPVQMDGLKSLIRDAVTNQSPFSLIRLSDGEGYLFPKRAHFTIDDCRNRERHWWGTELPASLADKIIDEARTAIAEADLIGIPSIYRFIRDNGEGSSSLTHSLQGRGLVEVLAGIEELASGSALFTEDKANVALFANLSELHWLTSVAERIVIVSSVRKDALSRVFGHVPNIEFVEIPTHHKTTLNSKYCRGAEPLPYVYSATVEILDRTIRPGDLALVAGGIVGKIFLGHCRRRGAVSIDLGHVIDDWISSNASTLR